MLNTKKQIFCRTDIVPHLLILSRNLKYGTKDIVNLKRVLECKNSTVLQPL